MDRRWFRCYKNSAAKNSIAVHSTIRLGGMMRAMPKRTDVWWRVAVLLVGGVCLRLLFFKLRPPVSGDSLIYGDIANNILQHRSYAITMDGVAKPTLIRLPGYPLFLALSFLLGGSEHFGASIAMQIVLSLAGCSLLGVLAARLGGRRAGLSAFGLSMLCPFTANYSVVPLTEALSLFCIIFAFFSFERWNDGKRKGKLWNPWLLAVAFPVSYAVLLRPDRALLAAVLIPAVAWSGMRAKSFPLTRRISPALAITVLFVAPLSLWGIRNWRVLHVFQPLSPKYANDPGDEVPLGFMRWYRTWGMDYRNTVQVYWTYDGSVLEPSDIPPRAYDSAAQRARTQKLLARYNDESASTPQVDAEFGAIAEERIAAHPVRYYLLLPVARLADMWLQPRTELLRMPLDWWNWRRHRWKTAFSYGYAALNLTYLIVAVFGFRKWKRNGFSGKPALAWALVAFVLLRSLLLATLDNAEQRYTIDCFPVVLLLASFAFARWPASAEPVSPSC